MTKALFPEPTCQSDETLQDYVCLHMLATASPDGLGELAMGCAYPTIAAELFGEKGKLLKNDPFSLDEQQERLLQEGWAKKHQAFKLRITPKGVARKEHIERHWLHAN